MLSTHFQPVTGAGIDINGSIISAKISTADGNALVIAEDNGLFVPKCNFTDEDRVILDTLPMLYVTNDEMNDAISRAVVNNVMTWEELGSDTGVAKIGNTYYPTIAAAIAAILSQGSQPPQTPLIILLHIHTLLLRGQ